MEDIFKLSKLVRLANIFQPFFIKSDGNDDQNNFDSLKILIRNQLNTYNSSQELCNAFLIEFMGEFYGLK